MPNIRHELIIGCPAEQVFAAITSQKGLSGWWTPEVRAKPERNSTARFAFGAHYFKEMRITELEPAKHLKWTCTAGTEEWLGTTLAFDLRSGNKEDLLSSRPEATDQIRQSDRGQATLLIFNHDGWQEYTPMFAECNYTWGQFLRSLKLLCETGKGRPWPQQHRG